MIYPKHIGFIADGNRTWARHQGLLKLKGHKKGFENTKKRVQHLFLTTPIQIVTIWALSTENLKNRSQEELSYLFVLYKLFGEQLSEFLQKHHINFCWKGNPAGLPQDLVDFLLGMQQQYYFGSEAKTINVAINHGGRDEIIRGVQAYVQDGKHITDLDEASLPPYLDFGDQIPLEMVIRTKGNLSPRTSGFMSRRSGYSQLYFCPKFCPEFSIDDLEEALRWFDALAKERNYGK